MKIFKRWHTTQATNNFYGSAPTEAEMRLIAENSRLRLQAVRAEAKLRELVNIYESHCTQGDDCVVYDDPEGALDEMWEELSEVAL